MKSWIYTCIILCVICNKQKILSRNVINDFDELPYRNAMIEVGDTLGSGAFGAVAAVDEDEDIVAKLVVLNTDNNALELLREKYILDLFKHMSLIPRALDIRFDSGDLSEHNIGLLFMEKCKMDMTVVRKKDIKLSFHTIQGLFFDYTVAIAYFHASGFSHNDIKPGNLMVSQGGYGQLIDFGLMSNLTTDPILKSFKGTYQYSAPEKLHVWMKKNAPHAILDQNKRPKYSPREADVWGLASVFFQVCTGEMLGTIVKKGVEETRVELYDMTPDDLQWYFDKHFHIFSKCKPFRPLFERMTDFDHKKRPTFKEIIETMITLWPHLEWSRPWQLCPKERAHIKKKNRSKESCLVNDENCPSINEPVDNHLENVEIFNTKMFDAQNWEEEDEENFKHSSAEDDLLKNIEARGGGLVRLLKSQPIYAWWLSREDVKMFTLDPMSDSSFSVERLNKKIAELEREFENRRQRHATQNQPPNQAQTVDDLSKT